MASPIFHVATAADWAEAKQTGRYATSTRGRTLAEEGFVHAARADQWQGVRKRYYADATEPLVLLVIDPGKLDAPVVEEAPPGGTETFPHVYGAIPAAAVTRAVPLGADGEPAAAGRSFMSLFLEEMSVRAGVGFVVIVVAVGLGLLVLSAFGDVAGLVTILVLLVLGAFVARGVFARRTARTSAGTERAQSTQ
ncbi:hypothetical protein GCM10011519_32320 [Marmoricola endophyticus]|uniref:DUF952 domain-containing protein n=1 Tax=Marmoricola endophyticus TaxID=2040280 RepID=A0A917BRF7_9ACTN|nr:DUF952 domain-containing protein [Marmoricola endophyticus]GGF55950.1 hypothetical protein GCM10011519_32320 [Marmoricola endophyticus]